MKIVGINITHNPSICYVVDGKVVKFYDETRFVKEKMFNVCKHFYKTGETHKFYSLNKIHSVDKIIFASLGSNIELESKYAENLSKYLFDKFKSIEIIKRQNEHHLYHALSGYYSSNFDDAICVIMDGAGTRNKHEKYPNHFEIESIYYINKQKIKPLFKHLSNAILLHKEQPIQDTYFLENDCQYFISSRKSSGNLFSDLSYEIGFSAYEPGKTMGLAAYGNPNAINPQKPEDLAMKLQMFTETNTVALLSHAVSLNPCKNIVLSGGYALNCLNNYKYLKHFPDYNFFVDPCAHDGGTSIGAALWLHRRLHDCL